MLLSGSAIPAGMRRSKIVAKRSSRFLKAFQVDNDPISNLSARASYYGGRVMRT